ncbi:hypothetical protein [Mariniluteicoccus flavus]
MLIIGTLKRGGVVPAVPVTQLIAPLGQVFGILLIIGLFTAVRPLGRIGRAVGVLSVMSLTLVVGVEFILNLVFPYLPVATIAALRQGPLGLALTITSLLFLATTTATAITLGRVAGSPRIALAAYALGAAVVALRAFVSPTILVVGLTVLTMGAAALSVWLLRKSMAAAEDVRRVDEREPALQGM